MEMTVFESLASRGWQSPVARGKAVIEQDQVGSRQPDKYMGTSERAMSHRLNIRIASRLQQMAELLEHQGEVGFRSEAYRRAAPVVEELDEPVDAMLSSGGQAALMALPGIGRGIAAAIAEMVTTGRWAALDRLTGELDPEALLMTLPGVGARTAERLHRELHVNTLEDLEEAANDGRLAALSGFGSRRVEALRATLQERLRTLRGRIPRGAPPPVGLLLEMDALYRRKAARNELRLIAPRRFNPRGLAWLPVMHEHRQGWHFTALFSNTARAHELKRTRDWVVLHVMHDAAPDWQCTVVTETRGALKGKRVVRGRERECEAHYAQLVSL
jgi:DNA uptake protein ComE-like DNA-binding protein